MLPLKGRPVLAQSKRAERPTLPPQKPSWPVQGATLCQDAQNLFQKAGGALLSGVVAASLLTGPAQADVILRLPASENPIIYAAQKTMIEAWSIVAESYFDTTFNHTIWPEKLKEHMVAAYKNPDPSKAFRELDGMLADLGDPFTRRVPPEEYVQFRVSADGELQGVGLLIANEPTSSGHLLVLAPIKGGPADRAGVLPGDEVVSINDTRLEGMGSSQAANLLRGKEGTAVRIKLMRRSSGIPGVPGVPEPRVLKPQFNEVEVTLNREPVKLTPVYATALSERDTGRKVGYLRLTQFSNNAAEDLRSAIVELEGKGATSYILDLRNNPGGLVTAGIDVAALFLDGSPPVFDVLARDGERITQVVEEGGMAVTHKPLVVLVNGMSASASEIVSGALHDNHRATIVGDHPTYGKGRIQSVFELQDGSALFVTVAKYQTPGGTDIDLKGIRPDRPCNGGAAVLGMRPKAVSALLPGGGAMALQGPLPSPVAAPADADFSPGIPMAPGMEKILNSRLESDRCVLAATSVLREEVEAQRRQARSLPKESFRPLLQQVQWQPAGSQLHQLSAGVTEPSSALSERIRKGSAAVPYQRLQRRMILKHNHAPVAQPVPASQQAAPAAAEQGRLPEAPPVAEPPSALLV